MKKITLGFSILVASAIFITSCNKKTNPAPEADMEFDTTVDATYANTTVTDVDMICGFIGESVAVPKFVAALAGYPTPTVSVAGLATTITWAPGTKCSDGKTRSGSIVLSNPNPVNYYRDYSYVGTATLNNYIVDGWLVDDSTALVIKNLATLANQSAASVDLRWSITGNINMTNVADPAKKINWNGSLNKKIVNTKSLVPLPNALTAITWSMAVVEFEGSFKGFTIGNIPFTYTIGTTDATSKEVKNPLVRDYTCSPDKVIGVVTTPSIAPVVSEFHPFIHGTASFTTSTKEVRTIDFSDGTDARPCDNSGMVIIKGIAYKIDFKK